MPPKQFHQLIPYTTPIVGLTSFAPLLKNQKFYLHKGMLHLQVVEFLHPMVLEVYKFYPLLQCPRLLH
jgi:hypothetical protein